VVGLAASATAAHLLGQSAGITDTDTVHGLLARLEHTSYQLPGNAVIVLDEAAMCDTRTRLALQRATDAAGVKVVDLGDDRQAPSVDAGGLFTALKRRLGAVELTVNHRFADLRQRDAAEQLRDGHANAAVTTLGDLGLVREFGKVADAHEAMVAAWLDHLDTGEDARMYADTNKIVADLNVLARDALLTRGRIARRGHTYKDPQTGRRILLAEGDRVRLCRNDARLHQPDGRAVVVRNGMEGTVLRAGRRGLEVQLDPEHTSGQAVVVLPAGYVAADVDYGYAATCDKAQGSTVDHSLYHPTDRSSSERAYVALSRGRKTNTIYAVQDSGWEAALSNRRAHTIAVDQQPRPRPLVVDREHVEPERRQGRPIAM
jgi:ATP-dependent exoDNAse (exonuclease V) alpha subunit